MELSWGLTGLLPTVFIPGVIGVASHLCYFIHGEHHRQSLRYLALFLTTPVLVFLALVRLTDGASYNDAAKTTIIATVSYLTALITSIITYRVFFHSLGSFPGPFSYRVSKLAQVFDLTGNMTNHLQAEQMRQKYGDIVRVGPNELSIFTTEGLTAIAGPGSKCTKGPFYDAASLPWPTMHTTRDRVAHDKRRKIWDRGFSSKTLREYEPRLVKYSDELITQLKSFSGKPLDASRWFNYYSFDVMGDLAFGQSFDMLRTGESHHAISLLQKAMLPFGALTPIPWVFPLLYNAPGLDTDIKTFMNFCDRQLDARKQKEPKDPDLMSWLIDAEKNSADPVNGDKRWTCSDTRLIIVAGSDTTAATLTFLAYHLAKAPDVVAKLREELRSTNYSPNSATEFRDLQDAKYLNGVINEALRLHPAVPSGVQRLTPPEGIEIDGKFIPGSVVISAPLYTMGRLESYFQHSKEFMPERWGDKPELVRNKAAFTPFSSGVYGCVGKTLALMEMRSVIARIVTDFDITFAPGEDGSDLMTKTVDSFTLHPGHLNLVFTLRK